MGLIFEADVGFDQLAGAFDVDIIEAVDHDVADGGVFEQLFQRAQAEDLIEDLFGDAVALRDGHGSAFILDQALNHISDLAADAFLVQALELILTEGAQELGVNLALDFEPAIGTGRSRTRYGAGAHAVFAAASLAPVTLSTKARNTLSISPALWRSATTGRALLTAASMVGEVGMP